MSATADVPHRLPGFRLSPERRGFRHPAQAGVQASATIVCLGSGFRRNDGASVTLAQARVQG